MRCPQRPDRPIRVLSAALLPAVLISYAAGTTRAGAVAQSPDSARKSVWDGVYSEKQAERGRKSYEDECASCHPIGRAGDESAPPLVGPAFTIRWNEQSVADIFLALRTTMPQAAPASLSKEAYADITAYLLKLNKYPAGDAELVPDTAVLGRISIDPGPPR